VHREFESRALTLVESGYRIVPVLPGQKRVVLEDWEQIEATASDVRAWAADGYAHGNIGVLTAHTPAIDIDVLDEEMARALEAFVLREIGDAPIRIGKAPKRLMLFRTNEPFKKITSTRYVDDAGNKVRVEVLGDGQQFVAYGIHPDTKKPYQWTSLDEPLSVDADSLPLLTPENARLVIDEFHRLAAERGWKVDKKGREGGAVSHASDDPLMSLKPRLEISDEQIKRTLAALPGNDDYEAWLECGMALHHQFAGDARGLELWDEWSESADNYDPDALGEKWRSFAITGNGQSVTFATLISKAKDAEQEEKSEAFEEHKAAILAATTTNDLMGEVARNIRKAKLEKFQRGALAKLMQKRFEKLNGAPLAIGDARRAVAEQHEDGDPLASAELELALAKRVLNAEFADGERVKRFAKVWWVYEGGVWRRAEDESIERRVLRVLARLIRTKDGDIAALASKAVELGRADHMNALITTVAGIMARSIAEDTSDDPLSLRKTSTASVINCANGELWFDLTTGNLDFREHSPDSLLTTQISCEYDELASCPTFDAAIRKVFQLNKEPEEVIRHWYEMLGYIIQPTREIAAWMMMRGGGSNGKSFLLQIITAILGDGSFVSQSMADIAHEGDKHFTDALQGKLMLLDDDLKQGTLLPDDWMKKLSENKVITANPKFGKPYNFACRATPVILSNHWPATVDLSEGMRRRAQVFLSDYLLTDADKDPAHKRTIMSDELPGVLNHLIAGWQRVIRRGGRFDPPDECIEAKELWLAMSNPTALFARECLQVKRGESVSALKVFRAYLSWLMGNDIKAKALGQHKFYDALRSLGYRMKHDHNANVICDVVLEIPGDGLMETF